MTPPARRPAAVRDSSCYIPRLPTATAPPRGRSSQNHARPRFFGMPFFIISSAQENTHLRPKAVQVLNAGSRLPSQKSSAHTLSKPLRGAARRGTTQRERRPRASWCPLGGSLLLILLRRLGHLLLRGRQRLVGGDGGAHKPARMALSRRWQSTVDLQRRLGHEGAVHLARVGEERLLVPDRAQQHEQVARRDRVELALAPPRHHLGQPRVE